MSRPASQPASVGLTVNSSASGNIRNIFSGLWGAPKLPREYPNLINAFFGGYVATPDPDGSAAPPV